MAAAVILLADRRAQRYVPGAVVQWTDNAGTHTGVVAPDDGDTRDLQMGPPGGPTQHLVAVYPDEPIYVDATDLRLA